MTLSEQLELELRERVSENMLITSTAFFVLATIFYIIIPSALLAINYVVASTMEKNIISLYGIGGWLLMILLGWILLNIVQEVCAFIDWHNNRKKQKENPQ